MIKLVAVDMDGTFLKNDSTYDRQRFQELYRKMTAAGIQFVVASGNQYYQLREFFPQAEELAFVAENGAYVQLAQQELFAGDMDEVLVTEILQALQELPTVEIVLCGKNSAYTNTRSEAFFKLANHYYVRLQQ